MAKTCPSIEYKLDDNFGFIAGRASMALSRKLHQNFKEVGYDITAEQWSVLIKLWEKDGESQQGICSGTNRDKPSITRLIDNLEKNNYVVRIPDRDDRRINMIYLTSLGREIKEKLIPVAQRTFEEALTGIADEEVLATRNVLNKIFYNLTATCSEEQKQEAEACPEAMAELSAN